MVVCCKVWTLGVWGELACHERLFNPPPQFSRLGTWCPTFFVQVFCLSPVCTWMEGWGEEGGYLLLSFLLSIFLGYAINILFMVPIGHSTCHFAFPISIFQSPFSNLCFPTSRHLRARRGPRCIYRLGGRPTVHSMCSCTYV